MRLFISFALHLLLEYEKQVSVSDVSVCVFGISLSFFYDEIQNSYQHYMLNAILFNTLSMKYQKRKYLFLLALAPHTQ